MVVRSRRLLVVVRAVYGARNGFAPLLGVIEGSSYYRRGLVRVVFSDGSPEGVLGEALGLGYLPVVFYGLSSFVYLELRGELRRVSSRFPVVVGGPHVEGAYWQVLRDGVRFAVVGDGENAVEGILDYFFGEGDVGDIPNIAFRDESGGFRVTRIERVDLDAYPGFTRIGDLFPPIEIMRGCPFRCRFCQVPWLFKKSVRYRSVDRVLDIVGYYVGRGRRRIRFTAPIGFAYMSGGLGEVNYDAIESLLGGVRGLGGVPFLGSFPSEVRPEYVDGRVLDIVRRYAGNKRISVGLQSGSDRLLRLMWRDHSVEDALEAVRLIMGKGFKPVVDLIFSLPGETEEDVEATVRVMRLLAGWRAKMRLHTFMPLPGTPLALERPIPLHPLYRETVKRLMGLGVFEGYWEDQEEYAWRLHCLMASDPKPTREPEPLLEELEECRRRGVSIG